MLAYLPINEAIFGAAYAIIEHKNQNKPPKLMPQGKVKFYLHFSVGN